LINLVESIAKRELGFMRHKITKLTNFGKTILVLTLRQGNLSTHLPIMGPNTEMEADSTAPYIAAYSKDPGQILIMYKPTENSHILQAK